MMLVYSTWGSVRISEKDDVGGYTILLFLVGLLIYSAGLGERIHTQSEEEGFTEGYDQGQIDALSGVQTHEQFLVYPTGDTIPCDTLYLPIRE